MNLQEQISRMKSMMGVNESTTKDLSNLIQSGLERSLMKTHKDVLCKVEVRHPLNREVLQGQKNYEFYGIYLYMIGGYGTEYFPQTQAVVQLYHDVMDEAWDFVYNYFGLPSDVYKIMVKTCDEKKD